MPTLVFLLIILCVLSESETVNWAAMFYSQL